MKSNIVFSFVVVFSFISVGLEAKSVKKQLKQTTLTELSTNSKPITIPIVIHYDKVITDVLYKKYGSESKVKIKALTNKFVKEAEEKFSHPSLKQKVILNLMDVKFLKNITNILEINDNSAKYLKNYCEWQAIRKKLNGTVHYSVLITGVDLYYINGKGEKNQKRIGISYNNGVCNFDKSCAIIEWKDNMGRLLAHELAHSLGIKHDGPPNNSCKSRGLMMSSIFSTHTPTKGWSSCNLQDLETFLGSEKARCLK